MNQQCLTADCIEEEVLPAGSGFANWITIQKRGLAQIAAALRQRRNNRKTYNSLVTLDDATLKDIGLSRDDVTWASKLPDSASAATELEIIARRKSQV